MQPAAPRGLGVRYGAAPVGNAFMTLMVFTGKGRRFSVLLITADHAQAMKCLPALAPTLDSLTLRR